MLLFFASHDGHTRKIAQKLCDEIKLLGTPITRVDLEEAFPDPFSFDEKQPVILIAPIRYGFHLPITRAFARLWQKKAPSSPLVLISINLTARKEGKNTAEGNVYLRNFIKKHALKPTIAKAIAGKLDYPRYNWFDKTMIRLIMTITGGPTDPNAIVDFTKWDEIPILAKEISALSD